MKIYKREVRVYQRPIYGMGFYYDGVALTEWQSEENEITLREEWKNELNTDSAKIEERFIPINN